MKKKLSFYKYCVKPIFIGKKVGFTEFTAKNHPTRKKS